LLHVDELDLLEALALERDRINADRQLWNAVVAALVRNALAVKSGLVFDRHHSDLRQHASG
jgi:hypothetical protein